MTYEEILVNIDRDLYEMFHGYSERDLFDDLVEAFKLDPTDSVVTRMYTSAWDKGHAGGMKEVAAHFKDLVKVFKGE